MNYYKFFFKLFLGLSLCHPNNWSIELGGAVPLYGSSSFTSPFLINVNTPYRFSNVRPFFSYHNYQIDKTWGIHDLGAGIIINITKTFSADYSFSNVKRRKGINPFLNSQQISFHYKMPKKYYDFKIGSKIKLFNTGSGIKNYTSVFISLPIFSRNLIKGEKVSIPLEKKQARKKSKNLKKEFDNIKNQDSDKTYRTNKPLEVLTSPEKLILKNLKNDLTAHNQKDKATSSLTLIITEGEKSYETNHSVQQLKLNPVKKLILSPIQKHKWLEEKNK